MRKNLKEGDAEYKLFVPEDMNNRANVQRDWMKPGAHAHLFCSALQFAFRYKTHSLKKREEENTPGKLLQSLHLRDNRAIVWMYGLCLR